MASLTGICDVTAVSISFALWEKDTNIDDITDSIRGGDPVGWVDFLNRKSLGSVCSDCVNIYSAELVKYSPLAWVTW